MKIEGWKAVGIQFALYQFWFILFAINVLHRAQYYMQHYGTLNEHKRGRDLVPDSHHTRVSHALIIFTFVRSIGTFALGKDSGQMPYLDLWTPLRLGAFHIALDYCKPFLSYLEAHLTSPQSSTSTTAQPTKSMPCGSFTANTTRPSLRHHRCLYGLMIFKTA